MAERVGTVWLATTLLTELNAGQGVCFLKDETIHALIEALEVVAINRTVDHMPYPPINQYEELHA